MGTALVAELVRQAGGTPIYLTTISRRMGLYQRWAGRLLLFPVALCALPPPAAAPACRLPLQRLGVPWRARRPAFNPHCLTPPRPPPPPLPARRCGFEEVWRSEVPPFLQAEYLAGLLLAWLVARDRLVLMRRAPGGDGAAQQQAAQQQAVQQERGP